MPATTARLENWSHDGLAVFATFAYWPARAMNKVVRAGGILSMSSLTVAELRRIERTFVTHQGRGRPLIPYTRRENGRLEITAYGWRELERHAAAQRAWQNGPHNA